KVIAVHSILIFPLVGITCPHRGGGDDSLPETEGKIAHGESTATAHTYTPAPGVAHHIVDFIKGKTGIVDVVAAPQQTDSLALVEIIDQSIGLIAVIGPIAAGDPPHIAAFLVLLEQKVDGLVLPIPLFPDEFLFLGLGIQDLDLVDDILGETLGGHFGICTEKYLPIDQDLVHRFSIDRYAPVTGHLDPW